VAGQEEIVDLVLRWLAGHRARVVVPQRG
jgi:hypothetical protein